MEALLNLLDNAIQATPAGGAVVVWTDSTAADVRLCVEDGGPGVPPEDRERIFRPFYRLLRAPLGGVEDGSGLGLAIVRSIARAHGGRVELAEGAGGGSVFRLVLPDATV